MRLILTPYAKVQELPMLVARPFDGREPGSPEPEGIAPRRRRLLYEQRHLAPAPAAPKEAVIPEDAKQKPALLKRK